MGKQKKPRNQKISWFFIEISKILWYYIPILILFRESATVKKWGIKVKRLFTMGLALIVALSCVTMASAKTTRVKTHIRSNGTVVQSHYRTPKNKTKADNWSTKGNTNPYTGKKGTKSAYKY